MYIDMDEMKHEEKKKIEKMEEARKIHNHR